MVAELGECDWPKPAVFFSGVLKGNSWITFTTTFFGEEFPTEKGGFWSQTWIIFFSKGDKFQQKVWNHQLVGYKMC